MNAKLQPRSVRPKFRPGISFRATAAGGRLYEFERTRVRILAIERGQVRQWIAWRSGRFRGTRKHINFEAYLKLSDCAFREPNGQLLLFPLEPSAVPIAKFMALLPRDVWDRVVMYPWRLHYRILCFFVRGGQAAIGLHDAGSYALCAALASADRLRGKRTTTATIRRWTRLPQHLAIAKLGIPPSKRIARLFRKIPARACQYWSLHTMQRALQHTRLAREISHLPRITEPVIGVLKFVTQESRWLTPACLRELSEANETDAKHASLTVARLAAITQAGLMPGDETKHNVFPSLQAIRRAEPQLDHRLMPRNFSQRPIEPSCFADESGFIEWVRTPAELWREGQSMHHCVYSYLDRMCDGKAAVASVWHQHERATLLLLRTGRKRWKIGYLRGPCNQAVSPEMLIRIRAWLAQQDTQDARTAAPF